MSSDQKQQLQERLAQLKKKRLQATKENRQEVYKERRKKQVKVVTNDDDDTTSDDKYDERARNWDYTIEEDARWVDRATPKSLGAQNMNKLAELTYNRETAELSVDKESYEQSKANSATEDSSAHYVDPEKARMLAEKVAADTKRRHAKRKNHREDAGSYINEKNRQFNMKLQRERRSTWTGGVRWTHDSHRVR